jgi:Phosphodiester glycosidase
MEPKVRNPGLAKTSNNRREKRARLLRIVLGLIFIGITGLVGLVVVVSVSPETGARGADFLRDRLGTKPVAILEAFVFTVQDTVHQILYQVEQETPASPWEASENQASSPLSTNNKISTYTPTPPNIIQNSSNAPALTQKNAQNAINPNPTRYPMVGSNSTVESILGITPPSLTSTPKPTQTPTQVLWSPANVPPLGNTPDEGIWTSYIKDQSGTTLAYKTFLHPDDQRPYVVVGIVGLDLSRIQLHYQLGLLEPDVPDKELSTGQIPSVDLQPGILLAAFNGGFKTLHGHYGIFVDGKELIPPIDKMGTVAIYKDNRIRIGEWGTDLTNTPDLVVYRQNCPLLVHDGEINPLVYNNSVNDWGGTFSGNIVTFRSGIGLSRDEKTLYYFAGNGISMPILAKAMLDAGAYQAMQLDINSYYVLFTKFEFRDNQWTSDPLLPKEMVDNLGRFLTPYPHDFFYITIARP